MSASASHYGENVSVQTSRRQRVREENLQAFRHRLKLFCGVSRLKHVGRPTDETDSNQRPTGKAIKNGINISFLESDFCGRNVPCTGPVCGGVNIAGRRNRADPRVSALALKKNGATEESVKHAGRRQYLWLKKFGLT